MEEALLLDTNAFIDGHRGKITACTLLEHAPALRSNPLVIYPKERDFIKAAEIGSKLFAQGTPVGGMDLLIASVAVNRGLTLATRDKDFHLIQKVESKLRIQWLG